MNCSNCGTLNHQGSKFCIKCGNNLDISQNLNMNHNTNYQTVQQPINQTPIQQVVQSQSNSTSNISTVPLNYLMYIIAILIKPFQAFKEEESKLCNSKTSLILSSIVAGSMMLINLLKSMISAIFVKTLDYSTFQYKTTMDFSKLKDLDYVSLIGKNLLIYAGIIVAIALVYYLAGLVFKKAVNFIKLLSISATSMIPFVVLGMIASFLLGKIWAPLSIVAMVVGAVYSILIFLNLINDSMVFDKVDQKIYFHLICLSILGLAGYYLCMNLFISSIGSGLGNLGNELGGLLDMLG